MEIRRIDTQTRKPLRVLLLPNALTNALPDTLDPQVHSDIKRGKRDIVFFAWHFLGIKLHPGQIRFLRGADGLVNVLVPGNRFGKTVLISIRHIWYCYYKTGLNEGNADSWSKAAYSTAALAPHSEILGVDYRTIKEIMEGRFVISKPDEPIQTNFCRLKWYLVPESCRNSAPFYIQFRDNSNIKFFSGGEDQFKGLQGQEFGYGSYDEGGRSLHLQYEITSNLYPRFQQMGAPLDLVSTPDQRSPSIQYHYEIYLKGTRSEDGFRSFEGSAYENVYLSQKYFDGIETGLQNDPLRDQVLFGKFVFAGNTLYDKKYIDASITKELNGGERFVPQHTYVIGTDTALLTDEMVHTVLDTTGDGTKEHPYRLVRQSGVKGRSKSPEMHVLDYCDLFEAYNKDLSLHGIVECFSSEGIRFWMDLPREIRRRVQHYAWAGPEGGKVKNTGSNAFKKVDVLIALKKLLNRGGLLIPEDNKELIKQMSMYREDDDKLQTDRVISLALAVWLATEGRPNTQVAEPIAISW